MDNLTGKYCLFENQLYRILDTTFYKLHKINGTVEDALRVSLKHTKIDITYRRVPLREIEVLEGKLETLELLYA